MSLTVECAPLPPIKALQAEWAGLEVRAAANFFRSWRWIGSWIEAAILPHVAPDVVRLLRVFDGTTLIGLGLVCAGRSSRLLRRQVPAFFLAETGVDALDAPTVEYNGLLTVAGREAEVFAAAVNTLVDRRDAEAPPWRWSVGVIRAVTAAELAGLRASAATYRVVREERCPVIALDPDGVDAYYASISRNSRQQIRRAVSLVGGIGALSVTIAAARDADEFLAELKALHHDAWRARKGHGGAFASPVFESFARAIVDRGISDGSVELARISVAGRILGILFNFRCGGHVYAYQSGFRFADDNRIKPGLICHVAAAQHAAARGATAYHFMAGQSRYKRSLGNSDEPLYWVEIGRGDFWWRAESRFLLIRDRLRRIGQSARV